MSKKIITIKQVPIEEAVKVSTTITDFDRVFDKAHFENKYLDKQKLIIVAYMSNEAAGFIVGYNKHDDKSFYCWMAGVSPKYRKKGVFKSLIDYHNNWAKEHGYKSVKIKTRNNRREMLSYLVKYGFNFLRVDIYQSIEDNRILAEKNF